MNKDRYNTIIDEMYKNYLKNFTPPECPPNLDVQPDYDEPMSKDMFIYGIKTNDEFAKKWGLKIEERELIRDERIDLYCEEFTDGIRRKYEPPFDNFIDAKLKTYNIPTKKITVTYKDEIIEFYE